MIENENDKINEENIVIVVSHKGLLDEIVMEVDPDAFGADVNFCGICAWKINN